MKDIIVVVGPTAVGKSDLSVKLAKRFDAEIISGDAYQCYRELNIGSGKITEKEMQGIKHHLINVVGYRDEYNVKIFQEKARQLIDELKSKNKKIIVCGGTGLYIKALLYDYVFPNEPVDDIYQRELESKSNEILYKQLLEEDPKSCDKIHPNNRQRIIRALMITHQGLSKSEIIASQQHRQIYDAYVLGLTCERMHLYERINERVEKMFALGLKDEVMSLIKSADDFKLQSFQGIGYKEFKDYYNGNSDIDTTKELIQQHSRNFAKRQYTWFRNQMDVKWYDIETDYYSQLIEDIENN